MREIFPSFANFGQICGKFISRNKETYLFEKMLKSCLNKRSAKIYFAKIFIFFIFFFLFLFNTFFYTYSFFFSSDNLLFLGYPAPKDFQPAQPPPTQSPVSMIMCTLLLQWFMGYLNHVDLLLPHVHVLKCVQS